MHPSAAAVEVARRPPPERVRRIDDVALAAVMFTVERLAARLGQRITRPASSDLSSLAFYWDEVTGVLGEAVSLEVAFDLPIGGLGLTSYVLVSAPTLGVALETLRTDFLPRMLPGMSLHLVPVSRDYIDVRLRGGDPAVEELALAVIVRHFALLERPIHPSAVTLRRKSPRDPERWRRHFGISPRFNASETSLRLDATHLQLGLRTASPEVHRLARDLVVGDSATAKVRAYARAHLTSKLDITTVADALNTTPRTLQRWLQEEHASLRGVVHDVRMMAAREMLELGNASVAVIAAAVGFAHVASFARAFVLATGEAPAAYRKRVRSHTFRM